MVKLNLDVLDKPRQDLWEKLEVFKRSGVLGGGTAIALQIGHRVSLDFDIFTEGGISSRMRNKALSVLDRPVVVEIDNPELLTLMSKSGLRLTILEYSYSPLYPVIKTKGLPLFDLADLASNKAFTIGRRGKWRDYVDLYFLLKEGHVTLAQVVRDARKRFGDEFAPRLFLEQLAYTKDLGKMEIDFLRGAVGSKEATDFFGGEVKAYVRSHLK